VTAVNHMNSSGIRASGEKLCNEILNITYFLHQGLLFVLILNCAMKPRIEGIMNTL